MIQLLLPVSDRPTIMIGAGGLLLVVSHLFAVTVLILWVGLEKSIKLNSDVRNILLGQILSTAGVALTQTPYFLK
jgi:hypothetical protein